MQHTIIEDQAAVMDSTVAIRGAKNKFVETAIESRFGPVTVQPEKAILFPHGMPGIAGKLNFCLTALPNTKNAQFKLLQSLDDHALSFIVVPSTYDNQLIETVDIIDTCTALGISKDNLLLLFLVTVHETSSGRKLSVNAKAPVFIDAVSRVATQYVFQNNNYEIQHFIS